MNETLKADVVIIGAGVAGGLVGHQLALADKSVIILEAGRRMERGEIVERYRGQLDKSDNQNCYPPTVGAPIPLYNPPNHYLIQKGPDPFEQQYLRVVGGTTWHWAASTWRFLPNDFKLKTVYGVGRDWPISYDDIEEYYYKAEVALGCWGNQDYGSPRKQPYPMQPLPLSYNEKTVMDVLNAHNPEYNVVEEPVGRNSRFYDGRPVCCGNNNCMPICPIGAMYNGVVHVDKAVAAGAQLIVNAVVYKLEVGANKKIVAALYKDAEGVEHRVEGKYFVVAANGIETPKLLLISEVANSSGMVGRNLMDHPGSSVSFYADRDLWAGRGPQEMSSLIGYRDGPFRSEECGKKLQLTNTNPLVSETEKLFKGDKFYAPEELDKEIQRRSARHTQFYSFHEILPQPENRIVASAAEKDAFGIPRPEIHYKVDDYVKRSGVKTRALYAEFAKLLGGTDIWFSDQWLPNNHITGATIMGSDPKNSVVDGHCRSYDHENMFVASSSAMTTVGTVNVTLTIAALSLRIADQLKKEA